MKNADFFRKRYPIFAYRKYNFLLKNNDLEAVFDFEIKPDFCFQPKIIIKNIPRARLKTVGRSKINNFVFHLGLIEMLSYWKATCSPQILIEAGYLKKEQISWWRDLIMRGMGQFFYENNIDFRDPDFLKIKTSSKIKNSSGRVEIRFSDRWLVAVGGGRDCIVTLEKLRKQKKEVGCFMVNPKKAALAVYKVFDGESAEPIVVERKTDPKLLELNKKGFLNGHTPFTALLSFLSIFCAVLFDYKNIAFSNEKSANEGNLKYLGKIINHQYSKSSDFEKKFRDYVQKYLARNINYLSFLRPYTDLEISKMFIKYPRYFSVFSSCNLAQKSEERWCRSCSKCLFVYATLYPFLEKGQLIKIFGEDLFQKRGLLKTMRSLTGQGAHKPFECVGTLKESKMAFQLSLKKAKQLKKIPYLLRKI
jgi:hypothetical protein